MVTANDEFVSLFLKEKITYTEFINKLVNFVTNKEFSKYKKLEPKNINDIIKLNQKIKSKIYSMKIYKTYTNKLYYLIFLYIYFSQLLLMLTQIK